MLGNNFHRFTARLYFCDDSRFYAYGASSHCALTRVGFKGRADHGHHGGLAVAPYAVLQDSCQLAVPLQTKATGHTTDSLKMQICNLLI